MFPTDTVYGFGVCPHDVDAIQKLRALKQRPKPQPFTLHLGDIAQIDAYSKALTQSQRNYIQHWLPGAVTVLLSANDNAPTDAVLNGNIGLRVPIGADFECVNAAFGPLLGTSVNERGLPPLYEPEQIIQAFGADIALLVTAESDFRKTPSAVVDLTCEPPNVIRGTLPSHPPS